MITVKDLSRNYGEVKAVQGVSFTISKGEIVGLLGHNGAGKTTIMKMLTGYLEPSAGSIEIDGAELWSSRMDLQKRIGYLPEVSPLYPDMPVVHYLEYVASLRRINAERQPAVINEAIDKTGLRDMALRRISTLSKGYKQRLGVAQAVLHNPDILILDEPTSGLDPSQIHEMRSLVKSFSENSTVLLSTHILQEVEAVCDRVIIILQGRVAADAKLHELQSSNRLIVSVDQDVDAVAPVFKSIDAVKDVESLTGSNGRRNYAVSVKGDGLAAAPKVARTVVEKGWELYELEPEQRNLETVFREISTRGGADAK